MKQTMTQEVDKTSDKETKGEEEKKIGRKKEKEFKVREIPFFSHLFYIYSY